MTKPPTDRWYNVWETAQANDPWNRNALCVKSAILDGTVKRHIEAYIPWRQQKLFDYYAHLVRDRIAWVKGNLGVKQPDEKTLELEVWFSLDVDRVIDFFCGPHLHVRTPLAKQWIAVSTVFSNPYPAGPVVLI
jgi:hypothetical protein